MSTYAISFDLKYDTSESYTKRYQSLMTAIRACPTVWTATTAFCLVETTETLEALERRLYLTLFDATKDKLLVINVSYDAATIRGPSTDLPTLRKLLPGIQEK
jgi:hypothetical protein